METRDSADLGKPQKKSVSGSCETDELAGVRPEVLSEERTPRADQEMQDKAPHYYIPIQRNSIFNRTVRHRSKGKARGTSKQNCGRLADSLENGNSVNEPLNLNFPQSSTRPWRIPTGTDLGAKRASFHM
ncbi:ephexin-1-like [Physeter macrocephalus]|uniref:Ephexin-1-like n=1 Tax=Physeter macrocephalus TaxID=9755 RepID=A0A455ARG7_PHYMC|nr:ephexin-1-like [Physeter catodon]|eukprot:XP_028338518.1 ephexin-1-like [Physeter catodon]